MHLILFLVLYISTIIDCKECRKCNKPVAIYKNADCKPFYSPHTKKCAKYYKCNKLEPYTASPTKCFYKGHYYDQGETIPGDASADDACYRSCTCNNATIYCRPYFCPLMLFVIPNGCYVPQPFGNCCAGAGGYKCPKEDTDYCLVKGQKRYEGERFDSPSDVCSTCVCSRDKDSGDLVSVCRKIICPIFLTQNREIQENCAPIYSSLKSCCPIDFMCPSVTEDHIQRCNGKSSPEMHCRYGKETFVKGTTIKRYSGSYIYKCTCRIPPFFTCIQYENTATSTAAPFK